MKLVTMATETVDEYEDSYDDMDELALLMEESKNMESQLRLKSSANETSNFITQSHFAQNNQENTEITPTPGGTPTPTPDGTTPTPNVGEEGLVEKGNIKITNKMVNFNKQSEEEKNYKSKIRQYRTFFEKGKFNEL